MQVAVPAPARSTLERVASLDILRGFIMLLMALDHVREYFTNAHFNPTDIEKTNLALFFTRWVTHFCAPNFILFAGISAFMIGKKLQDNRSLQKFLWTRGAWLIALDVMVFPIFWYFNFNFSVSMGGWTLWGLGWSMVALGCLVNRSLKFLITFSLILLCGHNAFDTIHAADIQVWSLPLSWLWLFLHEQGSISWGSSFGFYIGYPLIPWVAVMTLGYALGHLYEMKSVVRQQILLRLGVLSGMGFVLLRAVNIYGDPKPWVYGSTYAQTLMSFLNVEKYPPSLLFVLMTICPTLFFLSILEKRKTLFSNNFVSGVEQKLQRVFVNFGRVPLFYYILHIPFIHGLAMLLAWSRGDTGGMIFLSQTNGKAPASYGYSLLWVYVVWLMVIAIFLPLCRNFGRYKSLHKEKKWLSYL
jgi:uncharacterized membrane protein